jgi:hypothetical protein
MLLVAGAIVLLVSILIGQKLGDRVLLQTEQRIPIAGTGVTPVPEADASGEPQNWKRLEVISVATDPGFPDPRVTRPPARAATAPPHRATPIPELTLGPASHIYTSPPLPIPLVSHAPGEVETEPPTLSPEERNLPTGPQPPPTR